MTSFSTEEMDRRLRKLLGTQQSIQGVSTWLQGHTAEADTIARAWSEHMLRRSSSSQHQLDLLYVANDVLQASRRRSNAFTTAFAAVLPAAVASLAAMPQEHQARALRVLKIWEERGVYSAGFIAHLRNAVPSSSAQPGDPHVGVLERRQPALMRLLQATEASAEEEDMIAKRAACVPQEVAALEDQDKLPGDMAGLAIISDRIATSYRLVCAHKKVLSVVTHNRNQLREMLESLEQQQDLMVEQAEESMQLCDARLASLEAIKDRVLDHCQSVPAGVLAVASLRALSVDNTDAPASDAGDSAIVIDSDGDAAGDSREDNEDAVVIAAQQLSDNGQPPRKRRRRNSDLIERAATPTWSPEQEASAKNLTMDELTNGKPQSAPAVDERKPVAKPVAKPARDPRARAPARDPRRPVAPEQPQQQQQPSAASVEPAALGNLAARLAALSQALQAGGTNGQQQ